MRRGTSFIILTCCILFTVNCCSIIINKRVSVLSPSIQKAMTYYLENSDIPYNYYDEECKYIQIDFVDDTLFLFPSCSPGVPHGERSYFGEISSLGRIYVIYKAPSIPESQICLFFYQIRKLTPYRLKRRIRKERANIDDYSQGVFIIDGQNLIPL